MARYTLFQFLRDQLTSAPAVPPANLSGKTVIVVGANTGIGFETARHFALMGAGLVIMACRNKAKGEAALERLVKETGYERAEMWLVDLASFTSVSAFADRFEAKGGRLDILVMNAGVWVTEYTTTEDGWESALQTNNLAAPLLSLRLLPRMLETAKEYGVTPRLVTLTSEVHYWAQVSDALIQSPDIIETLSSREFCTSNGFVGTPQYSICKLLNVLFTRALQGKVSDVIVNCCNPGFCGSGLRRHMTSASVIVRIIEYLALKVLGFTSEEGSRQPIYCAVAGGDEMRGAFISKSKVTEPSDFVMSEAGKAMQEKYWNNLGHVLSKADPKIPEIVKLLA